VSYWANAFAATVHAAVIWTFAALRKKGVKNPSVAVLSRSNSLISDLSVILSETHIYNHQPLPIVDHDVVWDAELSATAAVVVASIMEWPTGPAEVSLVRTLRLIAGFYKLKNAEEPSNTAAEHARKYDEAAAKVAEGEEPRIKAGKALVAAHAAGVALIGEPVADWKAARRLLQDIPALSELFREVRLVRTLPGNGRPRVGAWRSLARLKQLRGCERSRETHPRTGTPHRRRARSAWLHPNEHAQGQREGVRWRRAGGRCFQVGLLRRAH
jgi:DNA helicase-2/ATP-dependent DNA helicase PcrA